MSDGPRTVVTDAWLDGVGRQLLPVFGDATKAVNRWVIENRVEAARRRGIVLGFIAASIGWIVALLLVELL